jgi:pimeloyl-ACP methyl ester carboxylesterase
MVIVLAVVVLILGISFCCYWVAFYNPESRHAEPVPMPKGWRSEKEGPKLRALYRQMNTMPYEQVFIQSYDGLRLGGAYYHVKDGAPVHIQFHGYRGSGTRDLCGLHRLAIGMGHNVLTVSQRSHGASQGNTMTFGIREKYDCLEWARYAAERFGRDVPIVLVGVSMGAATVMMASELDLPENVIGIIADCGYTTPKAIICKVSRDIRIPPWLSYPFIAAGALVYGGFRLWERGAVDAVPQTKVPILLIHGEADRYVPCDMSREIQKASAGKATLKIFPEATHGISYVTDPRRYERIVKDFLKKCNPRSTE